MPSYDIVVTAMENRRTLTVLAHHLAQKPGVSLQKALSMLSQLPVVYDEHVADAQARETVAKLAKMGVTAILRMSAPAAPGKQAGVHPVEPGAKAGTAAAGSVKQAPARLQPVVKAPAADAANRLDHLNVAAVHDDGPHRRRKLDPSVIVLVATISAVIVVLVVIALNRNRETEDRGVSLVSGKTHGQGRAGEKGDGAKGADETIGKAGADDQRKLVHEDKKAESQSYVDSANSAQSDPTMAISFFKMAISLNPQNIDAWYGLMSAYTSAAMPEKAEETRLRMIELFGEAAETVSEIMKSYGPVQDASLTDEGTYRIEYRTRVSGEARLKEEAFRLAKALRISCQCTALSLFASNGRGKGLLVHLPLDNFPQSYDDFVSMATIRHLE